jgi:hypothetical protein
VITLAIFMVFSALWLGEPLRRNHAIGFGFIALGARGSCPRSSEGREERMKGLYDRIALLYFWLATGFLMLLALVLLVWAIWEVLDAFLHGEVLNIVDSAGLVIVGFAIVETSRFIAEEEIFRQKELRSAVEARRSLTKFITIIVIAVSLEALVMVFEAGRTELAHAIYPAFLFATAMFALIALGAFQWLSSRIAVPPDEAEEEGEDSLDHHGAEREEAS